MISKTFPIAERLTANGLNLIRQLQQLLLDEAALLKKSDQIALLNVIVEKKQPLINEINQFSRQMAQVLTTETLPNDQNGMLQYLEKAKATGLTAETMRYNWLEIITITQICKLLNEQNGGSIDILRRYTQRSLHVIKGNTQRPNTYRRDGSTQSDFYSRELMSV
ncbi:MAG: flagellar protein FlgN [Methylococcaceae bacterium]|nr:flagellar protein FlgN [Methylococcaceae bacterium]